MRLLERASKVSMTPPYGPTLVSIPEDLHTRDYREETNSATHRVYLCCEESSVKEVMQKFNSHERVAVIAGYEVDVTNAHDELNSFIAKANVAVYAEPFASRSPYDGDPKYFMGDLPRRSSEINDVLRDFSMVLIVGGSVNNVLFPDEDVLKGKEVVQVAMDWIEASKRPWDTLVCNPKNFLSLAKGFVSPHKLVGKTLRPMDSGIETIFKELRKYPQYSVFDEVPSYREILRTAVGYRRRSLFANRAGFIGWAIPVAFGYASAGGKSLAVVGDGSFNYSFQALWSAQKYGGVMKVLVINNQGYNSLRGWYNVKSEVLSPTTSPWKLASSYGFEAKEFDDYRLGIEWLMHDDEQRLAEIRV
jgi:benzoylformate decarboxylase